MALSDSTQADRPNSAVCCMVCLSGFVKQCSLNVDSLMDFISACLPAEGSKLPPPGLAEMSAEVAAGRTTLTSVRAAPRAASAALGQQPASSVLLQPHPSSWWMLVVICCSPFLSSRWAEMNQGSAARPEMLGPSEGLLPDYHAANWPQFTVLGLRGCLCYAKTCLCFIPCASESCSCIECLMTHQVQFPLGNNVHDFVPVSAQ